MTYVVQHAAQSIPSAENDAKLSSIFRDFQLVTIKSKTYFDINCVMLSFSRIKFDRDITFQISTQRLVGENQSPHSPQENQKRAHDTHQYDHWKSLLRACELVCFSQGGDYFSRGLVWRFFLPDWRTVSIFPFLSDLVIEWLYVMLTEIFPNRQMLFLPCRVS
jgi:hypothetical protein